MLTKKIELRVPNELFSALKAWARQKNTTVSDLARYAIGVVYYQKKDRISPEKCFRNNR